MNLKKSIAILSLAVYLVASCGIVINSHYCMKRLVAVRLFESKSDACARCGMELDKDNHCCHDEVKVIKMANDQNKIPVLLVNLAGAFPVIFRVSDFLASPFFNGEQIVYFREHSPPWLSGQDSYIMNRVFRI
ncbi:MAG: hypothetical protein IPQ08_04640 [Chitinophagaceae bacterium]|nr:hypothetical protein [Chitinophagaceae bacterium]